MAISSRAKPGYRRPGTKRNNNRSAGSSSSSSRSSSGSNSLPSGLNYTGSKKNGYWSTGSSNRYKNVISSSGSRGSGSSGSGSRTPGNSRNNPYRTVDNSGAKKALERASRLNPNLNPAYAKRVQPIRNTARTPGGPRSFTSRTKSSSSRSKPIDYRNDTPSDSGSILPAAYGYTEHGDESGWQSSRTAESTKLGFTHARGPGNTARQRRDRQTDTNTRFKDKNSDTFNAARDNQRRDNPKSGTGLTTKLSSAIVAGSGAIKESILSIGKDSGKSSAAWSDWSKGLNSEKNEIDLSPLNKSAMGSRGQAGDSTMDIQTVNGHVGLRENTKIIDALSIGADSAKKDLSSIINPGNSLGGLALKHTADVVNKNKDLLPSNWINLGKESLQGLIDSNKEMFDKVTDSHAMSLAGSSKDKLHDFIGPNIPWRDKQFGGNTVFGLSPGKPGEGALGAAKSFGHGFGAVFTDLGNMVPVVHKSLVLGDHEAADADYKEYHGGSILDWVIRKGSAHLWNDKEAIKQVDKDYEWMNPAADSYNNGQAKSLYTLTLQELQVLL